MYATNAKLRAAPETQGPWQVDSSIRDRFAALQGFDAATTPFLGVAMKFWESQFQSVRLQAASSPAGQTRVFAGVNI